MPDMRARDEQSMILNLNRLPSPSRPNEATTKRPAMRDTALFIPEAIPEYLSSTDVITVVVKGRYRVGGTTNNYRQG
jgi:hypothetical protein